MSKSKFSAVLAFVFFALFSASALAEDCVPMAKKGEIPNPSVLADKIETSLQADPSGNGLVEGANITPNGFMKAIVGARGTVENVSFLPTYLRSLYSAPMPDGETIYSRVCANDAGIPEVDITEGFPRPAAPGEVGWYDANSNYLILAGNCSNSPLNPLQREKPKHVAKIERPAKETRPEFLAATPINSSTAGVCMRGYILNARLYHENAAFLPVKVGEEVVPVGYYGLRAKSQDGVLRIVENESKQDISNMFGADLRTAEERGEIRLDGDTHHIRVDVVNQNGGVAPIFIGPVTEELMLLMPPWFTSADDVFVRSITPGTEGEDGRFNVGMFSPLESGIFVDWDYSHSPKSEGFNPSIEKCAKTVSLIVGSEAEVVRELYYLRYPVEGLMQGAYVE